MNTKKNLKFQWCLYLYVSLGLIKNKKKYEEKIENLNKYIEKLKGN